MRRLVAGLSCLLVLGLYSAVSGAQDSCVSRIEAAKAMLRSRLASVTEDEIQAPRGPKVREGEIQAPQMVAGAPVKPDEIQAPRVAQARTLIDEADAACKRGENAAAIEKAKAAMELLK